MGRRKARKEAEEEEEEERKIIARLGLPTSYSLNREREFYNTPSPQLNSPELLEILHYFYYNEVRIAPEEHGLLITEHICTTRKQREEMTSMLFEEIGVMKLMFMTQEFLACIAEGRESALIVHMGHTYCSIVPIWKCNILRDKARILPIGGREITRCLYQLKEKQGTGLYSEFDWRMDIAEEVKIRLAYVSQNMKKELLEPVKEKSYEMPDGQEIKLGEELFMCTECLFDPSLVGLEDTPGLAVSVVSVLASLEPEQFNDVIGEKKKIVLMGASSMFSGMQARVTSEVQQFYPEISVSAAPERKLTPWMGGSIWADLSFTQSSWMTKDEYDEWGPSAIHAKCF